VLENLGDQERALQQAMNAKQLFAAAGDRGAAADALMAISSAYAYKGDLGRALDTGQEALALLIRIENRALTAALLCNLGIFFIKQGNLPLARARAEAGLLLAREIGLLEGIGSSFISTGLIALLEGDPKRALEEFDQAEAAYLELGDSRLLAWSRWHIAQALFLKGSLKEARQKHEEALLIRQKAGLKSFAAESQSALAAVELAQHLPAEAETLARAAVEQFAAERQADSEAWAQAILAEALDAAGKPQESAQALLRARALGASCQNAGIRLLVRRVSASIDVNHSDVRRLESLRSELEKLSAEARSLGMLVEELEDELLLCKVLVLQGRAKDARTRAEGLRQAAVNKEMGLLVERIGFFMRSIAP
jgi:tetratricopeptide (TPR) repeat protein